MTTFRIVGFATLGSLRRCLSSYSESNQQPAFLRRYRKLLQDYLQKNSVVPDSGLLQVTDIKPGDRPNQYDVYCVLPYLSETDAETESRATSLALKLECIVNKDASDIRSQFYRNLASRQKLPSFRFTITTELSPPLAPEVFANLSKSSLGEDDFSSVRKPTYVYGLPRDELVQHVISTSRRKGIDTLWPQEQVNRSPQATSQWARVWKQRQDRRLEARRERRRARQDTHLTDLRFGWDESIDTDDELSTFTYNNDR